MLYLFYSYNWFFTKSKDLFLHFFNNNSKSISFFLKFFFKQVISFRYEWFDELSTEVVTFTFFVMTAYKFQPASNNPYLQLNQNPDDGEDDGETTEFLTMQTLPNDMDEEYINGNAETVLDLIEHNYNKANSINANINSQVIKSSTSDLGNVLSRKQISSTQI